MDIELDPPRGITGFPIGMPAGQVKEAAASLGHIKVQDDGLGERFHYMKVLALHPQFEITFHIEDGKTLGAAEVWIPRSGPEVITVTWRGINVFTTPARKLLNQIKRMGLAVADEETLHPLVPNLSLGFTRDAGHEVPLDSDGMPLYFQAVLVAPEDYYDALMARPGHRTEDQERE